MRSTSYTCQRCLSQLHAAVKQTLRHSANSNGTRRGLSSSQSSSSKAPVTRSLRSNDTTRTAYSVQPLLHSSNTNAQVRQNSTAPSVTSSGDNDFYVTSLGNATSDTSRVLLQPNNLFHPLSRSPAPGIRKRSANIKETAWCPHSSHQRSRQPISPSDPENNKPLSSEDPGASPPAHVSFECPDCGIPVACCEEHWQDGFEAHLEVCDTLRQVNEDEHDLHSGRFFPEFNYPGAQRAEEFVVNMSNWDTFFYTRDFPAINEPRSMRQVTRHLTYPLTLTSVLHELSPYSMRGKNARLTQEGLRSFSALRYTMHPPRMGEGGDNISSLRIKPPPVRLFILGARAESSLPRNAWLQMTHCFPRSQIHLIFIGPEAMTNRDDEFPLPERTPSNPFGGIVEDRLSHSMKITTYVDYFQSLHEAQHFYPYDPYFDAFVLFHPGLGHVVGKYEWESAIPMMLETKCPIICTGFTEWDMMRDMEYVKETVGGEMDVLLQPGENIFRSLKWDLNNTDTSDVYCANWGVWAFRGKRYEATNRYTNVQTV